MPDRGNGRPLVAATGGAMLQITHGRAPNGRDHVMVLTGELDCSTGSSLTPMLANVAQGARDVRLDLSGVTFLDVTGLRVLCDAAAALQDRGQRLVVEHPSRAVRRLVQLARMSEAADIPGGLTLDGEPSPSPSRLALRIAGTDAG